MIKKALLCVFMSFCVFFMSISDIFTVYAAYEEDDKIFDFLTEYVKQRNVVNQAKIIYDEYVENGIGVDLAFNLATNQVGSLITDTAALTNAIKNTWNSLTGTKKSNLIDAYNQVSDSSDVVVNIPIDSQINLNIPAFDSNYKSTVSSYNSSSISVVDVVTFYNSILSAYANPTGASLYNGDSANLQPNSIGYSFSSWSSRYCYLVTSSFYKAGSTDLVFRKGYVCSVSAASVKVLDYNSTSSYVGFCYDSSYNPSYYYLENVIGQSYLKSSYDSLSRYYVDYRGIPDPYELSSNSIKNSSVSYDGAYYVVPTANNILNIDYQTIINDYHTENNYNDYSVNYYPYTVNVNPDSDMPNDENWLNELKKIFNGETVNHINITINNNNYYGDDEPDNPGNPDDPTTPDDSDAPTVDIPDGWFDGILESISGIFSFLDPTSDDFFLKVAFIPKEEFIKGEFERIRESASNKIPVVSQIFDIGIQVNELLSRNYSGADSPTFNITLPELYGGGTYSVIDFSYFDDYRSFVHGFIIVISFYHFFRRLLRKLPKIILH